LRLITFGCSLTYGDGLTDKTSAWPYILGKQLELSVANKAVPGFSNKQIWLACLKYEAFKPTDTVVILWSHLPRYTVLNNYDSIEKNTTYRIGELDWEHTPKALNKKLNSYFNDVFDEFDSKLDLYGKINHIDLHLKNIYKCNKVYHFVQDDYILWDENQFNSQSWNKINIPKIFMGEMRKQYPLANDNSHPGVECHSEYANKVFEWIKEQ
jgi:hypothetical protein